MNPPTSSLATRRSTTELRLQNVTSRVSAEGRSASSLDPRRATRRQGVSEPLRLRRGERTRTSNASVPNAVPYHWATPRKIADRRVAAVVAVVPASNNNDCRSTKTVPPVRFELTTCRLRVGCTNHCATEARGKLGGTGGSRTHVLVDTQRMPRERGECCLSVVCLIQCQVPHRGASVPVTEQVALY